MEIGNLADNTDYKVTQDVCLDGTHYIFGIDEKVKKPYFVCDMTTDGMFKTYDNCISGDDYLFMLNDWNVRISKAISKLQQREIKDFAICDKNFVEPISCTTSIKNKVIVIKPNVLCPENRYSQKQLKFVVGGLGAEGDCGSTIMCINIDTSKAERFDRSDVLGILKADKIPAWAKDKIRKRQEQFTEPIVVTNKINHIRS